LFQESKKAKKAIKIFLEKGNTYPKRL